MLKVLQWSISILASLLLGLSIFGNINNFHSTAPSLQATDIQTFKQTLVNSGHSQQQLMDAFHQLTTALTDKEPSFFILHLNQEQLAQLLNNNLQGLPAEEKVKLLGQITSTIKDIETADIQNYISWFINQNKVNYALENQPETSFSQYVGQYSVVLFFSSLFLFLLAVLLTLIGEYKKSAELLAEQAGLLQKLDANTRATALLLKQRSQG